MSALVVTLADRVLTIEAETATVDGDFLRFCYTKEVEREVPWPTLFRPSQTRVMKSSTQHTLALIRAADVLTVFPASAIEAASAGETPQSGSTEGESAVGKAETPNPDHRSTGE